MEEDTFSSKIYAKMSCMMKEGMTVWYFDKKKKDNMKLFEEKIYPIYKELYRFISCITRNETLAEDALQNTMEKAYGSIASLREPDKFKAWIFTIAKNETITLLRKYRRDTVMVCDNIDAEVEDTKLLPDELMINNEVRDYIIELINQLKPEYRDIILLRYYTDLSLQEIADVLNTNLNTVKTRHKRAKTKIAMKLKENIFMKDEEYPSLMQGGEADA